MKKLKVVVIDNYDSFTYNLVHILDELEVEVTIIRNNQFHIDDLEAYDKILISPGPGVPSEASGGGVKELINGGIWPQFQMEHGTVMKIMP